MKLVGAGRKTYDKVEGVRGTRPTYTVTVHFDTCPSRPRSGYFPTEYLTRFVKNEGLDSVERHAGQNPQYNVVRACKRCAEELPDMVETGRRMLAERAAEKERREARERDRVERETKERRDAEARDRAVVRLCTLHADEFLALWREEKGEHA